MRRARRPGRRYARLQLGERAGLALATHRRGERAARARRSRARARQRRPGAAPARDALARHPCRSGGPAPGAEGVADPRSLATLRGSAARLARGPRLSRGRRPACAAHRRGRRRTRTSSSGAWGCRSPRGCGSKTCNRRSRPTPSPALLDAARVADALASLLARLHRAGIRHGDLKASHVFLAAGGTGLEPRLIDLEGVRFARRVPERGGSRSWRS